MELTRYKEKKHKTIGIILFTLVCVFLIVGVILYQTYAIYEVVKDKDLVNGDVEDAGDVTFSFYIDDQISKKAPEPNQGYSLDTTQSYCTNQAMISWNDSEWKAEIKNLNETKTKCYLYFKKIYQEGILNGAIPDLGNGRLIPVIISNTEKPSDVNYTGTSVGGKVTKANITEPWYSYTDKRWANAVILKDETKQYQEGEEIPESNIESYVVWIPRYRYQIWNGEVNNYLDIKQDLGSILNATIVPELNQPTEIQVVFEDKNKDTPSNGSTAGTWLTHPAFTSFDTNGMWVGKFETGYNQNEESTNLNTTNWNIESATPNIQASEKVIIKPNIYSWRGIDPANAFYTAYNYERELDSHMMKNSEWGAVAYLQQSIYGSHKKVRINNSSNYVTGSSAIHIPVVGYNIYTEIGENTLNNDGTLVVNYNNAQSVVSSTTENYYGIYDMSGCAWDIVMGLIQSENDDYDFFTSSGFITIPDKKYYDLYDYDVNDNKWNRGKLGDATKELGPFYDIYYGSVKWHMSSWFADSAVFPGSTLNATAGGPWFERGGAYMDGSSAGTLSFIGYSGKGYFNGSFRIVLTP